MSLQIGDVAINRGEKLKSFYKVGEAPDHEVKIPYIIINGKKPGPTLCVLSGIHSIECTPIEAVLRLSREIEARNLTGILILVPVVNTEGFLRRTPYHNDFDHLNQNRVFPGDQGGSNTERVAYFIFKEFVSKSDYLIDAHCADLGEDATRSVNIWKTDDEKLQEKMVEMASCFDVDCIDYSTINGNTGEAVKKYKIPCIMTESGAPYPMREKDVQFHRDGVINLMKHLGMLPGKASLVNVPLGPEMAKLPSNSGGVWRSNVVIGQKVNKGEKLGEVANLLGDKLEEIKAPFNGKVYFLRTHYSCYAGDVLVYITKLEN